MKDAAYLIVDDCKAIRSAVSDLISTHIGSKQVFTADNGAQALSILESKSIDVIISDWEMPEIDGSQLLSYVRNQDRYKNTPFIMMSYKNDRECVMSAIKRGVSHYIIKPFTVDKLQEAVTQSWKNYTRRAYPRFSKLPDHTSSIKIGDYIHTGNIENISESGILVETTFHDQIVLFKECFISFSVEINAEHTIQIKGLTGRIVRIEARDPGDPDSGACRVAVHFNREGATEETLSLLRTLTGILSRATQRGAARARGAA